MMWLKLSTVISDPYVTIDFPLEIGISSAVRVFVKCKDRLLHPKLCSTTRMALKVVRNLYQHSTIYKDENYP